MYCTRPGRPVKKTNILLISSLLILAIPLLYFFYKNSPPPPENDDSDFPEVTEQLLERAEDGDLEAQYELGIAYAYDTMGEYTPVDEKVLYWLRRAAEGGYAAAQNEIGYIYRKGLFGRKKDIPTALAWLYSAAKQGDDLAHLNLAQIFRDGDGVERDDTASTKHFRISAELGYPPAQFEFGLRLREGVGIPRNTLEARGWISKASGNDFGAQEFLFDEFSSDEFGFENMAIVIAIGVRVSQSGGSWAEETYALANSISESGGIEKARAEFFPPEFFEAIKPELYNFGTEYQVGPTVGEIIEDSLANGNWNDPQLHYELFLCAALLGHSGAQYELAKRFESGIGVGQSADEAGYWLGRAAAPRPPKAAPRPSKVVKFMKALPN